MAKHGAFGMGFAALALIGLLASTSRAQVPFTPPVLPAVAPTTIEVDGAAA